MMHLKANAVLALAGLLLCLLMALARLTPQAASSLGWLHESAPDVSATRPATSLVQAQQTNPSAPAQGSEQSTAASALRAHPDAKPTAPTPQPHVLPAATPLPTPTPSPTPALRSVRLTGVRHTWQTWNNCGPATLAMNLSYYGSDLDQTVAGSTLRGNTDDKNVSPAELIAYAQAQGFVARLLVNGDASTVRALLNVGIPVLIETWLDPADAGGLGHYRLIVGYDDDAGAWVAYDTYVSANLVQPEGGYTGIWLPYAETDALWRVFNRTAVVIYAPDQAAMVEAILGPASQGAAMWQAAAETARAEIERAGDAYAWFNLGSSLTALGAYDEAAAAYDQARALGLPWRMLWYQFGPLEAYHQVGRHQDVIQLAQATLSAQVQIEEIHYWRSRSLQALGDSDGAEAAWQEAIRLNPTYGPDLEPAPPGVRLGSGF